MTPEPNTRSTLFPRFGSKYRFSGRTHYESKATPVDRTAPKFDRALSGARLSSRSMDGKSLNSSSQTHISETNKESLRTALAIAEKEKVARKSNTLDHRGDRSMDTDPHARSPIKNKKDKVTSRLSCWACQPVSVVNDLIWIPNV